MNEQENNIQKKGKKLYQRWWIWVIGLIVFFFLFRVISGAVEDALASVIGGMADCPVIAVPTSVGYGASFNGLSALLSMLNSCASGVSVVNIDNGFGAGYLASMINHIT